MTIKDRVNADFAEAYKAKNMVKKNFLGVVKGAIQTQESKVGFEANDVGYLKVINSLNKSIKETLDGNVKLGVSFIDQMNEMEYLKPYLPELMSEDIIREKVRLLIIETGGKNVGVLMGAFNKTNVGLAFDNKVVSKIIGEELK